MILSIFCILFPLQTVGPILDFEEIKFGYYQKSQNSLNSEKNLSKTKFLNISCF